MSFSKLTRAYDDSDVLPRLGDAIIDTHMRYYTSIDPCSRQVTTETHKKLWGGDRVFLLHLGGAGTIHSLDAKLDRLRNWLRGRSTMPYESQYRAARAYPHRPSYVSESNLRAQMDACALDWMQDIMYHEPLFNQSLLTPEYRYIDLAVLLAGRLRGGWEIKTDRTCPEDEMEEFVMTLRHLEGRGYKVVELHFHAKTKQFQLRPAGQGGWTIPTHVGWAIAQAIGYIAIEDVPVMALTNGNKFLMLERVSTSPTRVSCRVHPYIYRSKAAGPVTQDPSSSLSSMLSDSSIPDDLDKPLLVYDRSLVAVTMAFLLQDLHRDGTVIKDAWTEMGGHDVVFSESLIAPPADEGVDKEAEDDVYCALMAVDDPVEDDV